MLLLPLVGSYIADFRGINSFKAGRFSFNYFTTGILFVDFALVFLLLHDMWKSWRKGNDYRVEMASAREVQQRLVPAALPEIAAYRLAAAYLPAAEVGGDFYQVLEQRDSAALILVGDVSGKGLKAAMKGALAIGATRTLASEELNPGLLLTRLNRELVRAQDGGFITCLCARIARDGAVILANAGHLAPYCNGEEVELESGLPLGIAADLEYGETGLQLNHGDRLMLLSDGVVEARKADGELFGFERTRAISTQSAEQIAKTAELFGQEDDITVLTLSFEPA
jgi:serine phosphatase RsbU (regulator of sigma subunit)